MQHNSIAPAPPRMPGRQVHGMDCPVCRNFIPISIRQLLYESGISCPHCGLVLTINKMQSRQALEALGRVEQACRKVKETETFVPNRFSKP